MVQVFTRVLFDLYLVLRNIFIKAAKRYPAGDANHSFFLYLFVGQVVETGTKVIDFAKVLRALFLSPEWLEYNKNR